MTLLPKRSCPHCHQPTIPRWHAWLGSALTKPIVCNNCGATLVRVIDRWDTIVPLAPVVGILLFLYLSGWEPTEPMIWLVAAVGGLLSICMWLHTIRYKEVKPE